MKLLLWFEHFIFHTAVWKLVTVILLVMLFKTGIWYIPNLEMSLALALNPFANPFTDPNAHYLVWNWLSPFIAWLLGIKAFWAFFLLHLGFVVAFTALFIRQIFVRLPEREARVALIVFALLPVSATAYFWTGPDALTLLLLLLAVGEIPPSPPFAKGGTGNWPILASPFAKGGLRGIFFLCIGILLGMQHFEQALFAIGGLLFALLLDKKSPVFPLFLLAGIVAGKLTLIGVFNHADMQVNSGRTFWLQEHLDLLLGSFFFHLHHILWSVLGLGWLVALKYADQGRQSLAFFLTLAGLLLLLLVSADQTRVLAIVTFPLLAVYWLLNREFLTQFTDRQVAGLFLLWLLIPWSWVWIGEPRTSALPYDLAWLLNNMFGWFDVPANPALWPFADELHKW
ncbi:hypothetical protein [Thiothrix winogradskyi]|uniref:Glycosyltransferase RgtA/B/C/D-like domain-containing protein n=1 Tax=Thiothrix winogradskyi TaxID=96472 RepID=A0ABY3SU58_9GAMM|nr:hypothetical protein [Thiothrix winogradskyi]UJS22728.1 hypothetical protein L2Y54_12315 [Thiothrix winogradskyi]